MVISFGGKNIVTPQRKSCLRLWQNSFLGVLSPFLKMSFWSENGIFWCTMNVIANLKPAKWTNLFGSLALGGGRGSEGYLHPLHYLWLPLPVQTETASDEVICELLGSKYIPVLIYWNAFHHQKVTWKHWTLLSLDFSWNCSGRLIRK